MWQQQRLKIQEENVRRQQRVANILSEYERMDRYSSNHVPMSQNMHHILNGRESKVPEDQRQKMHTMIARVEERLNWLDENRGRLMMNQADQRPAFVITDPSARKQFETDLYREATQREVQAYRDTLAARRAALPRNRDNAARLERIELDETEEALNTRYGDRATSN